MAKEKMNVSAAIREALGANPDKTPSEISALLKIQGVKTDPQYVSNIKSAMKTKGKKRRRGRRKAGVVHRMMGRHVASRGVAVGNGMAGIPAAMEFIKAAGGLEKAKAALVAIEEIGRIVQ